MIGFGAPRVIHAFRRGRAACDCVGIPTKDWPAHHSRVLVDVHPHLIIYVNCLACLRAIENESDTP